MPFLRSFTVEYLHPVSVARPALLRLYGCDRLPSVSVVPSVCPVGSAAVPPGTPTQGATGRPPAPPFSTFRVPKIRKTKLFTEIS